MHYVAPVRVVAAVDKRSLRLLALVALWLGAGKATSAS